MSVCRILLTDRAQDTILLPLPAGQRCGTRTPIPTRSSRSNAARASNPVGSSLQDPATECCAQGHPLFLRKLARAHPQCGFLVEARCPVESGNRCGNCIGWIPLYELLNKVLEEYLESCPRSHSIFLKVPDYPLFPLSFLRFSPSSVLDDSLNFHHVPTQHVGTKMGQLTVSAVKAAIRLGRHADSATLYLNVKRSGAKSWGQRAVVDGRRHDLGLDPYPAVSLAKARRPCWRRDSGRHGPAGVPTAPAQGKACRVLGGDSQRQLANDLPVRGGPCRGCRLSGIPLERQHQC